MWEVFRLDAERLEEGDNNMLGLGGGGGGGAAIRLVE